MKLFLFALLATAALAGTAEAKYPDRPITIIVPLPPGGPADTVARVVGQKLQERLGQSVIIDNRPGALGLIGAEIGAHAKPDGYTVVMVSSGLAIQAATQPKTIHFDVHKDLSPVTYAVKVPMVVATLASQPFKTMKEFVDYAKSKPGQVSVGVSPGLGGTAHLTLERMKLGVGLDVVAVPYKGSAPAIQALLSGEVPAVIDTLAGMAGLIDDGKFRGLAMLTETPAINHEKIPTIEQAGFPGYAADTWNGFMVPGGTPKEIVDLLHDQIVAILALPDVKEKVLSVGLEPATNTPEQFERSFDEAIAAWTKVAADAHLKFE
jgi:tripartite-type tricarboxylate transporter receptor subunit TctC